MKYDLIVRAEADILDNRPVYAAFGRFYRIVKVVNKSLTQEFGRGDSYHCRCFFSNQHGKFLRPSSGVGSKTYRVKVQHG